jgi:hypothetical protein
MIRAALNQPRFFKPNIAERCSNKDPRRMVQAIGSPRRFAFSPLDRLAAEQGFVGIRLTFRPVALPRPQIFQRDVQAL